MRNQRTCRTNSKQAVIWTQSSLHQAVQALYRQALEAEEQPSARYRKGAQAVERAVEEAIVQLALQPDILAALNQNQDPSEALRAVASRYAWNVHYGQAQPLEALDPLSRMLVRHTWEAICQHAEQVARRTGEDPLEADPDLLDQVLKSLCNYVPARPMSAHIRFKLDHPETAVVSAIRQIENLLKLDAPVREAFLPFIRRADIPNRLKAQLLKLARGGGRQGLNYAATIRFFAQRETVALVKRFASTVQRAYTLYAEDEYEGITWQGRKLPANAQRGYIEAAYNSLLRREDESLDTGEDEWSEDGAESRVQAYVLAWYDEEDERFSNLAALELDQVA